MTPASAVTVLASATQTGNGAGAAVDLGTANDTCRLTLDVTAASGTTPSLVVTIETSPDNATWTAVRSWTAKTAAGREELVFQPCARWVRARWAITGTTPSFTFAVAGEKLKPYATLAQLKKWHRSEQFAVVADETLERHLSAASDDADSMLANRYTRPILAWGDDVRKKVCAIALWGILSEGRGFNPAAGSDVAPRTNHDDAVRWFKGVAQGDIHPQGIVDSTPDEDEGSAYIESDTPRGW